ncbi:MAG: hypothetical protein K2W95_32705 [Candidatus Obscuribacterales bacterium]|nr:hypothetical protein [Candidatus Obscuribacterales bacterium]
MSAEQDRDEYSQGVEAALSRAAKKARELARQTGTCIVVMRDGKLVQEVPSPDDQDEATARSA